MYQLHFQQDASKFLNSRNAFGRQSWDGLPALMMTDQNRKQKSHSTRQGSTVAPIKERLNGGYYEYFN